MAEDMKQAEQNVLHAYEAFNRGDFDESARYVHPDVSWLRVAEVEPSLEGRQAVRDNMEPQVWERQQIEIHGSEVVGESVVLDATFHTKGRGSGIEYSNRRFHVWRIKDGMGVQFQNLETREEAVAAARDPEGPA